MTPIRRLALITAAVAVLGAGPLVSQADARHMHNEYCPPSHRYDARNDDRYYDRNERDDYWNDSGYDPYDGYDRGYDPYSERRDFELKRDWPMLLGIFLGGGLGAGVGGASPY